MYHILSNIAILSVLAVVAHAQPYAVSVVDSYNPDIPCAHCDPTDALGYPDATQVPVEGYYSLGGLGWVEFELGEPVPDVPGADMAVWEELTFSWNGVPGSVGHLPDETADILLGFNANDWVWVGRVEVGDRNSMFIDIAGTGMAGAMFARVEDVSNGGGSSPGFDLDAIVIPEPSTVILLATASLLALRRRRNAA